MQDQIQVIARRPGFRNWILRYNTAVVLYVYVQVGTGNYLIAKPQDFRKAVRSKPMIRVIANVRLQHDPFLSSGLSATIDKGSNYMSHFGNVCV
ncbi:MAG TPA: hypothetical protein VFQ83_06810 [Candidatus Udaeobacter sp.]|nr:hypothetical protein [Candidatus Udaeobacter sp.]